MLLTDEKQLTHTSNASDAERKQKKIPPKSKQTPASTVSFHRTFPTLTLRQFAPTVVGFESKTANTFSPFKVPVVFLACSSVPNLPMSSLVLAIKHSRKIHALLKCSLLLTHPNSKRSNIHSHVLGCVSNY